MDTSILNHDWSQSERAIYKNDRGAFEQQDSPRALLQLDTNQQEQLVGWCSQLEPRKTFNLDHTSYGLKHKAEKLLGFYVSNGQLKGAMLIAGFEPADERKLNWSFKISNVQKLFKF